MVRGEEGEKKVAGKTRRMRVYVKVVKGSLRGQTAQYSDGREPTTYSKKNRRRR